METIKCPKCGSDQITAEKHGYNLKKAAAGFVVTGGVGLLAGMHGSNKIDITCLSCGNVFKPGTAETKVNEPVKVDHTAGIIMLVIFGFVGLILFLVFA